MRCEPAGRPEGQRAAASRSTLRATCSWRLARSPRSCACAGDLDPARPGSAQTFATGTPGANGIAFDRRGNVWVAANELNAIVLVTPAGMLQQIARNASQGPLEFPSALVFVGDVAYVANFDVPRRDNMDAIGKTALDGIGASIARIAP